MERNLPHIKGLRSERSEPFTSPKRGGGTRTFPKRNREEHGHLIKQKLEQAWQDSENEMAVTHNTRTGTYIEFQSAPGCDIKIQSLENLGKGIRLCNVRQEGPSDDSKKTTTFVTTFVPNKQRKYFFDKVEEYLTKETSKGNPKNKDLLEGIEDLQKAKVDSLWTDDKALIPDDTTKVWCEIWLEDNNGAEDRFNSLLAKHNIESKPNDITFPERIVKLILANWQDLSKLTKHSDDIAEYRRAKTTAAFLLSETPADQSQWGDDLLQRLTVDNTSNVAICLLDTGVNNGHPLIAPILSDSDCQTVNKEWGAHDHRGHGTLMAGLLGYGDLQGSLETNNRVTITHCLESVKILLDHDTTNPELWGDITIQGISRAEIQEPDRKRIICMPISSADNRDRGRPSSWSAAIDTVTSGAGADDGVRRLVIVAAGNADTFESHYKYPDSIITDSIHDPAQSWNALTVGAITNLQDLTDPALSSYEPLAKSGELSPFTTTSITWDDKKWPVKPDVVFEGGNLATDNSNFKTQCNDLSLVSTYLRPFDALLSEFNMTSAATAQAAHFAARIQSEYPAYWPETVRGLMVHSARWPDAVKSQVAKNNKKTELNNVLRAYGYGKPDLSLALYCAQNSLTLITEAEIQPFTKGKKSNMHLYELPWPKKMLEDLGESDVEMRITLSYFIEPGPGERGWDDRYRYASHALRFELNSPLEDKATFMKRINTESREEGEKNKKPDSSSPAKHWVIGSNNRDNGSIHSDIWKGTAVELASSNLVAIHPAIGWWRERDKLKKFENTTRYSLIISISTPENEVDLYTPVLNSISTNLLI